MRLEKLLKEEEIARLEREAKILAMQRQMTELNPIQRNNLLGGDIRHESLERGSGVWAFQLFQCVSVFDFVN